MADANIAGDTEVTRRRKELDRERGRRCAAEAGATRRGDTLLHDARRAEAQGVVRVGSWERDLARARVTWSAELYRLHGLEPGLDLGPYDRGRAL